MSLIVGGEARPRASGIETDPGPQSALEAIARYQLRLSSDRDLQPGDRGRSGGVDDADRKVVRSHVGQTRCTADRAVRRYSQPRRTGYLAESEAAPIAGDRVTGDRVAVRLVQSAA